MSNPFNYVLTDFFDTNIPAVYGTDYYVDYKSLRFQLSSTYYQQLTALTSNNKGLCALDLGNLPNLSTVRIREPNLVQFQSSTKLTYISAENISVPNLVLSGGSFTYFGIFQSPALQSLDLTGVNSIGNFVMILNNYQLSEINWGNSLEVVPNYIALSDNNLSNETMDTLYTSICAVSGNTSLAGKTISIFNPNSGTSTGYEALTALQNEGASVNITLISPTPTPTPTLTPTPTVTVTPTPAPYVINFTLYVRNESPSAYGTNNDAAVRVVPTAPSTRLFTVTVDGVGTGTVLTNNSIDLGGSGLWGAGVTKILTITDIVTLQTAQLSVIPGYNTADSQVLGTVSSGGSGVVYTKPGSLAFDTPYYFYNGPLTTPTPTPSITISPTPSISFTPTPTPSITISPTPSISFTPTPTPTPTVTNGLVYFTLYVLNETPSAYGTNNDAAIRVVPTYPNSNFLITVEGLGNTTIATNNNADFGGSGLWNAGLIKQVTVTDTTTSLTCQISVIPGYDTANSQVYFNGLTYTKPSTFTYDTPYYFSGGI